VQREKRSDAKRIMHELANRLLAGEMMCVFPEGTTTDGQSLLPFHANMFQAAVSASCPVQPICLMYEDAQGRQSTAPAYVGDMSLNESLNALLRATPLTAHLYVCDPLAPGADRRLLASEAQAAVSAALDTMRGAPAVAGAAPAAEPLVTSSSSNSPA
jgi:1-acyl-sn-glycerol-3-phosphate acyltransferase